MARREVGEINAGSMADIAFLLLIFFLVTTTMDVDAGIGRTLPLKIDRPIIDQPPVIKRNVLEIMANSKDDLLVEGEFIEIEELEEIVFDFYEANRRGIDENPDMPMWTKVTPQLCQKNITDIQALLEENPEDKFIQGELSKWETKLELCNEMPGNTYMEMSKSALIQLKNQAGTTYGLYIQIQNILKKVVNELRVKKCEELGYKSYFELDEKDEADQEIIKKLRVLVPERIIESKIER